MALDKQVDGLENELQKTRQDLYIAQMHTSELESEVRTSTLTMLAALSIQCKVEV